MEGSTQAHEPFTPAPPVEPWGFADEMHQLLGEEFEPDSLFLEESWTIGIPAAKENWRRRHLYQAERDEQNRAFREFNGLFTITFATPEETAAELLSFDRAARIAQTYSHYPAQEEMPQPPDDLTESAESDMTPREARRLLGTAATSTREQIKSAYRKLVKQWHPDQFEGRPEAVRRRASATMAQINEAYRVLCLQASMTAA